MRFIYKIIKVGPARSRFPIGLIPETLKEMKRLNADAREGLVIKKGPRYFYKD